MRTSPLTSAPPGAGPPGAGPPRAGPELSWVASAWEPLNLVTHHHTELETVFAEAPSRGQAPSPSVSVEM